MPIAFAKPPVVVSDFTLKNVRTMAASKMLRIAPLADVTAEQIGVSASYPMYNLGLDAIVENKPLSAAQLTVWQFILDSGAAKASATETISDADGTPHFASTNAGPFVDGTVAALKELETDKTFAAGDWEGRMLRIPALYLQAVWAHEQASGRDLIQVTQPVPPFLSGGRWYTWDELKAASLEEAKAKLEAGKDGRF